MSTARIGLTGARNVKGGLVLLSTGLAAGLGMSLYAFQPLVPVPASLLRYDDLPRRLLRLAHIAGVMLPLINIVVGPWLDRLSLPRARGRPRAGSYCWAPSRCPTPLPSRRRCPR